MTQASPSNLLYAQAVYALSRLQREYSVKRYKTPDEIIEVINKAITNFENGAGKAVTKYEPIEWSEIPNSFKMNRFWSALQIDINILQDQIDLLRASSIETHNRVKVEVKKASEENLKSQNRLKTLELYSNISDSSLFFLGDNFVTDDQIDWNAISSGEKRIAFIGKGTVGLGIQSQKNLITNQTKTKVLEGSNGLIGNNAEILDPEVFFYEDIVAGDKFYQFVSEINARDKLTFLADDEPNTWFEFEKYYVDESLRAAALNYNFNFQMTNATKWEYLRTLIGEDNSVNWANGLGSDGKNGTLVLNLEFDLGSAHAGNVIKFIPFGLEDNKNNPLKVKKVSVSLDKTIWTILSPEQVWIANGLDRRIVSVDSDNIFIGESTWTMKGDPIRFVRVEIEQPHPIDVKVGHHFYYVEDAVNDGSLETKTRQLGPVPSIANPNEYVDPRNRSTNNLIQKMEYFEAKRWVIAIRDVEIKGNVYDQRGSMVSQRYNVPGIVDRVALEADIEVPDSYDQSYNWVKFYVSPNDGDDWFQISRIQDNFLSIPEILAFNDPTPRSLREPGVKYYDVSGTVNSLRVKMEIERPADQPNSTPVVKSYKLKIKKRD